jgi:hypothetical protein
MKTLSELIQECEQILGSFGEIGVQFDNVQLTTWINEAIADITTQFPQQTTVTFPTLAGKQRYKFEGNFISVVLVEYPTGQKPPRYLQRRALTHPQFWLTPGYYDVVQRGSGYAPVQSELVISDVPPAGGTVTVEVLSRRNELGSPMDMSTLPAEAEGLIPLFVHWRAWQEVAMRESVNGDLVKPMGEAYSRSAERAEAAYRASREVVVKALGESALMAWKMDGHDRVW